MNTLLFRGDYPTKIWPNVPEVKIGQMVLTGNVDNFFQETEQVAMAPSNLVAGIEASEDRLLQGRLFSYADTQLHRIGTNGLSLPINKPKNEVHNFNQDGQMNGGHNQTEGVNYQPSQIYPVQEVVSSRYSHLPLNGTTQQAAIDRQQNFRQAGELYRSFSDKEKGDLIQTLGSALSHAQESSRKVMLSYFYKADADYGTRLAAVTKDNVADIKSMADKLTD
jgi:catalase